MKSLVNSRGGFSAEILQEMSSWAVMLLLFVISETGASFEMGKITKELRFFKWVKKVCLTRNHIESIAALKKRPKKCSGALYTTLSNTFLFLVLSRF